MATVIAEGSVRVYYADRVVVEHLDGHNDQWDLKELTEFNDLVAEFRRRCKPGHSMSFSLADGEFRCTFLRRSCNERV